MNITLKEIVYKGFFNVEELTLKTNDGTIVKRIVADRKNAVAAIVYDTTQKVFLLVSQWRPGCKTNIVEIAAGVIDTPFENKEATMKREIQEELGYKTDDLKLVEECYMSPGGSTELITIYLALVSKKIGDGGGLKEEDEEIGVVPMSIGELLTFPFIDAKTIIAVNYIRNTREKFV